MEGGGRVSVVGIVNHYDLDYPGFETRCRKEILGSPYQSRRAPWFFPPKSKTAGTLSLEMARAIHLL